MALSLIGYISNSEYASLFAAPAVPYVVQVLQSADPDDMKAKVDAAIAEIVALNALIAAAFPEDPEALLVYEDACLAGGGTGHTFTMTLTWVSLLFSQFGALVGEEGGVSPEDLSSGFCMAADAQHLVAPWGEMADAAGEEAIGLWQAHVGAAQGTRFMAGLLAYSPL